MTTTANMSSSKNTTYDDYPKVTYNDGMYSSPTSSAEHQLLMNAVSTCAYQLIQQLLGKNSDIVHEKGWHGQTVLHKACLIGDYETCRVLLQYGADPNAKNDYDETPLHYACKRGQPTIVHMLVQQGGDLDAVDKNGNSMCHHAAQTGSVYSLAYLHTQRPQYHTVNNNLQLPLHIVCQFGHVDAFCYLLKKEKSDIKQADKDGNNVLHIAAREGHQGLAWAILKTGGCELLHMENKEGSTPDDIAARRDKYGHRILAPLLSSLKKHKPRDYIVTNPMSMYYWIMLKPCIFYILILILCHMVSTFYQPGYQGYIMVVGLILVVWDIGKNLHRINHISRMQNPVFAGAFGAGLFHTTVHYFLFIHSSISDHLLLRAVSYVMMSITFYIYYTLLTRDPGRVRHSEINPATNRPTTVVDLCSSREKVLEYCTVCEIAKPTRTKHCRLCEVCYSEMDHHCLFLLTCIAKTNHVLFVWFLIIVVVSMLIYEINLFFYLSLIGLQSSFWSVVTDLFYNDAWTLSLGVANLVSILWGVNLVRFQLQIVSKGQLTAIQMYTKKQSGLTTEEKMWNIVNFLRFKPPYAQDPLLAAQNLI